MFEKYIRRGGAGRWKCQRAGSRPAALRVKHAKEKRKRNIKHTKKSETRVLAIKVSQNVQARG